MNDIKQKLASRKFWLAIAAFLGSIGTSIAGYAVDDHAVVVAGIVCTVLSAAIYQACNAYVAGKTAPTESTVTTLTGKATPVAKKEDEV